VSYWSKRAAAAASASTPTEISCSMGIASPRCS
jgi:hypothetical protein